MKKTHSWEVRKRAFVMWQNLGFLPWRKPKASKSDKPKRRSKGGDFYKGAFDNIPFLNDDAKRTFSHLLLRPGYMIRDYINGAHERYLAPLTALIVFYAFFALVSSVLQPVQQRVHERTENNIDGTKDSVKVDLPIGSMQVDQDNPYAIQMTARIAQIVQRGYVLLHLDQYPEEVDTQRESSLAAFEAALRSQGIPLFLSEFFFLWLAMGVVLRRYRMGMSAYAAASAYVLCQFCFFMLFTVLLSWGAQTTISLMLMFVLLVVDYHQWLGESWKKSIGLGIRTGIWYGLFSGLLLMLISLFVIIIAYVKL